MIKSSGKFEKLLEKAISGSDEGTRELLLYTINHISDEKKSKCVKSLSPYYNKWDLSKKYIFCRILIECGKREEAIKRLSLLASDGYAPAQCNLGTILYWTPEEQDKDYALDLIMSATGGGHRIAKRNYNVIRANQVGFPLNLFYYAAGLYHLLTWVVLRDQLY